MLELSILVPVYNEEKTIQSMMEKIVAACPEAQIIYIDDGSKDESLSILKAHAREQDLVLTKTNGGKGSAIRLGLTHALGTYTIIQDADTEYNPAEITLLLEEAKKQPNTAVFGSRFLQDNPNIYKRFLLGNKTMTQAINILFGAKLTDSYTCYKLLPTDQFKALELRSNGFEMEAEICAKCLQRGMTIREIPISYSPRTIAEGKKINWKDAIKGMWTMAQIRLGVY